MIRRLLLPMVFAANPASLVAEQGDIANERIPVRKIELERHWQVDCSKTWARLIESVPATGIQAYCGVAPDLARNLQLCVFIYQPPGSTGGDSRPDYRSAYTALQSRDCKVFRGLVKRAGCDAAQRNNGRVIRQNQLESP